MSQSSGTTLPRIVSASRPRRRLIAWLAVLAAAFGVLPIGESPVAAQVAPDSTTSTASTTAPQPEPEPTTSSTPESTTTPPIDSTTTNPPVTSGDETTTSTEPTATTDGSTDPDDGDTPGSTTTVADGEPDDESGSQTLGASSTQQFVPSSAVLGATSPVVLTLTGTSTSNVPVDSLTIQVPADTAPASSTNPFDHLAATDLGSVTMPEGANEVTVEVRANGSWTPGPVGPPAALPAEFDESTIEGVRITYTDTDDSGIAPGASASVELELELREGLELDEDIEFEATARTTVVADGGTASDDHDASFTIDVPAPVVDDESNEEESDVDDETSDDETSDDGESTDDEEAEAGTVARMIAPVGAAVAMVQQAIDLVIVPAAIDPNEISGSLSIQKVADVSDVTPGQTFNYTIQVQCTTATVTGCLNATVTDPLPSYLIPNGPVQVTGTSTPPIVDDGPPIVITFQDDLDDGDIGLAAGEIVTITIPVQVDPTIPVDQNGVPIVNTATVDADNADPKDGTATVTPDIEPTIAADTSKSYTPDTDLADSTDPITLNISGTNTSNVPVEEMVIQDPATDPPPTDVATSPFGYLAVTGLGPVTMPDGADEVVVEVYDASTNTWVAGPVGPPAALPAGVDPADIYGVRYTFTDTDDSGIPPGATASIDLDLAQRGNLPDPIPGGSLQIDNDVQTTVTDPEGNTADATADADFQIRGSEIGVDADKTIDPSTVNAGDSATVNLVGTNTTPDTALSPMESMTITEPAPGLNNPFENGLTFTGFTSGVEWPTGADEATIAYECSGVPQTPQTTTTVDTLPDPDPSCDVTGFTVEFTDTDGNGIAAGATATIPFTVDTDPDQDPDELTRLNIVRVDGTDGNNSSARAFDFDTIRTVVDRLAIDVDKSIFPNELPAQPGEIVTVQLNGNLAPFPESSVDADQIIVQEPSELPDAQDPDWFSIFQPQSVTATPVPACSSLTVEYTTDPDGAIWTPIPGLEDIQGATIVNQSIPANISDSATGIRFVYNAAPAVDPCEGGFPPGTSVAPNLAFSLRPEAAAVINSGTDPVTYTDCANSSANRTGVDDANSGEACDEVVITPADPGNLDPIDKAWDVNLINSRSQAEAGATISWSTQGYTGLGRVEISDMADGANVALPDSVYDEFDLLRIDPISAADDPHLTYDQIAQIELLQGTTWVPAPGDPCPAACDGTFPGYTIPDAERDTTIGFRLTYIESPTRVDRLTAGAPPVGTGVAPSAGNDRHIHPVFELRDVRRSDPGVPVIEEVVYNTANAGEILNTAGADAFVNPTDSTPVQRYQDGDVIELADVPVTVNSTKMIDGGPLGIPEVGVPQDQYPTARVTLTGANTTPAKIDELTITDDTNGDSFEWFNLVGFTTITPPADIGADDVTITLTGATPTDYTRTDALALTEADLTGVTGIEITYTGRIDAGAVAPTTATVVFDMRLRTEGRTSMTRPTGGQTVDNQATVDGADLVDFPNVPNPDNWIADSTSDADIDLFAQGLSVTASKSINPSTLTEPSNGPATVTIGGQPDGPSRTVEMVLTDADPRFWNQYDLDTLGDVAFTFPIDQVRVDALTGGSWSIDGGTGAPVLTGAAWTDGVPTTGPALTLPTGVTADQVQGLRYTFTRVDGANWENPATPNQTISFDVTRRDELNTGGPVLPDLVQYPPAPGETVPGRATNEMTAMITSSDVDFNGDPLTADGTAEATIDYLHASNSVGVSKSPDGSILPPGQIFTYTLTIENTGDVDITNPVVVDTLPEDADGPMVLVATDPNYAYTLDPADPPSMPTDPAEVTVVTTDTSLTFTFPDGSTLPIGATYTISFDMFPRPGLPAGVPFENTFGVTGDRPWDECTEGTLDPDTGECQASASNSVSVAGAMSVVKLVRAEGSDVLGVTTDPATQVQIGCTADPDGFYARPCVPIAEPGGDITWRMRFVNTGNLEIDRILGIDSLPAVGDSLATVPALGRGSQWQPTLTGAAPTLVDPTFGTLTVWYTTGASACDAGAPPVGGAAPNLLCPALTWTEATGGTIPTDATGIQVEILPATALAPGESTDVDLQMVAPPLAPASDVTAPQEQPDLQAYNTVGTSGRFLTPTQQESYTLVSERPRVGVALANGPISVEKVVTGDAAAFAPDSYEVDLSCTSVGVDVPLDAVNPLTLEPGTPQTINNLPYGATCTLVEGDNGQTSESSTTATVTRDDQTIETVTLTNDFDDAPLSITKTVESSAVDQDGTPVPYGPFEFSVDCRLRIPGMVLPIRVWADGYTGSPMIFRIDEGETVELTGIPVGSICTVTETDDEGAAAKTATADPAENVVVDPEGETVTVTLDSETTVTVGNVFTSGSVEITKVVSGNTAADGAAGPFTVAVECILDDPTGVRTVWDDDVILGGDQPLTATIDDLATGAVCQFEETESQGATSVTIEPAEGVVVGDGTVVTLTVTNEFPPDPTTTTAAPSATTTTVPGNLPSTGGSGFGRMLQIAVLLLGAGTALVVLIRRRAANA
ncbi:DUF5979 domain-containing protein [Ilumatobacter nonamiensis]|uniref:DUF5979 domain-containing protein n=1 Tax=Ilumatobacter nonamiensis TaxID=467093 RepID=UPI000349FCC1|nr:DUF5979 domain-containing protein [Ilumatobacter nonamiensis]